MASGLLQRVNKPKTHKGKLALEKRAPKIHENVKQALFMKGGNASLLVSQVLKELCMLKKPHAMSLARKNPTRPFEDPAFVEQFAQKMDASLFLLASHSKKRPHNLVMGRLFDHHILDMVEFGLDSFKSMRDFEAAKVSAGTKPCLQFVGDLFDTDEDFKKIKNLLADFFRGEKLEKMRLDSLEHVLQFIAKGNSILIRSYRILLKKSGDRIPRVELVEIGPSLDLSVRRKQFASLDLFRRACKQPKEAKIKKKKNISHDVFQRKLGTIHIAPQNLQTLQTRKRKALQKGPVPAEEEGGQEQKGQRKAKKARKA